MKQKTASPETQQGACKSFSSDSKPLDSSEILSKITTSVREVQEVTDDTPVWVCATRLSDGGCLREKEGRPPLCPIYSLTPHPLFVNPVKVPMSVVRERLTEDGVLTQKAVEQYGKDANGGFYDKVLTPTDVEAALNAQYQTDMDDLADMDEAEDYEDDE